MSKQTKLNRKAPKAKIDPHWWISLNSLVTLDWSNHYSWRVDRHTLVKDTLRVKERDYDVRFLDPLSDDHSMLELHKGDHCYIVPIKEMDALTGQQRCVLVRKEHRFHKGRMYLIAAEPPGIGFIKEDAPSQLVHIIGGVDIKVAEHEPHIIGIVEAVLVADVPVPPKAETPPEPVTSPTPPVSPPVEPPIPRPLGSPPASLSLESPLRPSEPPPASPPVEPPTLPESQVIPPPKIVWIIPPDDQLLGAIDLLNQVKGLHADTAEDLNTVQSLFYSYLREKYRLEIIPIVPNKTKFDATLGHYATGVSRFTTIADGIITAIQRDGYTSDGKVVREAHVVINRQPTRIVRLNKLACMHPGRFYAEMYAPQDAMLEEVFNEAAGQVNAIDLLYAWLAIYLQSDAATLNRLASRLEEEADSETAIHDALNQVSKALHLVILRHGPQLYVRMNGEAKALDLMNRLLKREASNRDKTDYYLSSGPNWVSAELNRARSSAPYDMTQQAFVSIQNQFAINIFRLLDQLALPGIPHKYTNIRLAQKMGELDAKITPGFLTAKVIPYLNAVAEIQNILDQLRHQEPHELTIVSIKQGSVDIRLEMVEALKLIFEFIVPWRRKHAAKEAGLSEDEQSANIAKTKAETDATEALAAKTKQEVATLSSDDPLRQEEIRKQKIENERGQWELERDRDSYRRECIKWIWDMLKDIYGIDQKDCPHEKRTEIADKLLMQLDYLKGSDLLLVSTLSLDEDNIANLKRDNDEAN
jgi:hypothetical protein